MRTQLEDKRINIAASKNHIFSKLRTLEIQQIRNAILLEDSRYAI
jgi:hypothetical protein